MTQLIRRHPLTTFFLLAFGITWIVWVPRAAGASLGVVGQMWTWAPAIAALLAAALTGGRDAVRELGARLVRWRVSWQWYLVVILGPAVFSLVVAGLYVLLGGS
jgi:CAAX protease family protein